MASVIASLSPLHTARPSARSRPRVPIGVRNRRTDFPIASADANPVVVDTCLIHRFAWLSPFDVRVQQGSGISPTG